MRTLIKVVLSATLTITVIYNIYTSKSADTLPNLVLANVEALAQQEGGSSYMGTAAKCEKTETVETYVAPGGYVWSIEAKAWFLNGKISKTPPPSYEKKQQQ